jgi:hypothetical protein
MKGNERNLSKIIKNILQRNRSEKKEEEFFFLDISAIRLQYQSDDFSIELEYSRLNQERKEINPNGKRVS